MLSCNVLCDELVSRGISATKKNLNLDSKKTSDQIFGILVETGDLNKSIVFPVDSLLAGAQSIADAADILQEALKESILPDFVDYDYFLKKDYVLSHVQLAFMERLWQPFLFRDSIFEGIIEYCYIAGISRKQRWLIEMRKDLLESLDISEDEMWSAAKENTFKQDSEFVLKSVSSIMGKSVQKLIDISPVKYMYSISNRLGLQGAVQVLNPKIFDLTKQYITDSIIVYPQSENNFLVAPNLPDVLATMKNIAENDTNYRYLCENLFIVGLDYNIQEVVPFSSVGVS